MADRPEGPLIGAESGVHTIPPTNGHRAATSDAFRARGGIPLLARQDGVLELLRNTGLHDRLRRNLDRLAGRRVAALSRLALLHDQLAHAGKHELAGSLQLFLR